MYFFTADWHLGHDNIMPYMKRPFAGLHTMTEALVGRFCEDVHGGDTTYFLGDMLWTKEWMVTLEGLPGNKVFIPGNHDKSYFKVKHVETRHFAPKDYEVQIYMGHYPLRTWPGRGKGAWNVHGHMHGMGGPWDGAIDVGVDAWDFRPVPLTTIIERLGGTHGTI